MGVVVEIDRHQRFGFIGQDPGKRALGGGLDSGVDLIRAGMFSRHEAQIDHRDIGCGHAHGRAFDPSGKLGQHQRDRARRAGGSGHHRQRCRAAAIEIAVIAVLGGLVAGIGVNGGHVAGHDAEFPIQHHSKRGQAVGGTGCVRHDHVIAGQFAMVDAIDNRPVGALCRCRDQHPSGAGLQVAPGLVAAGESAGAFEHDVDIVPGQFGRVTSGGHADAPAVDDQGVVID